MARETASPGIVRRTTRRRPIGRAVTILLITAVAACGGGNGEGSSGGDGARRNSGNNPDSVNGESASERDSSGGSATDADPQWGQPPLAAAQVPPVYLQEWRKADNRNSCAPIAPAALGAGEAATPRAATFGGGWGIAYDLPDQRSAFGVAGAGVSSASGDIYSDWPNRREWPDGSFAEYGPEGGGGLNQVAYLRVAGQDCLYNIWSRIGLAHLELLLDQLRRVTVPPA